MAQQQYQGRNNQPANNFFTQSIQRYGEDFLEQMNSNDVSRGVLNIFRGISRKKIDLAKYANYFLDQRLLEPCIAVATNKYYFYLETFNGMNDRYNVLTSLGMPVDNWTLSVLDRHRKTMEAYGVILTQLNALQQFRDVGYLIILANQLNAYRDFIME